MSRRAGPLPAIFVAAAAGLIARAAYDRLGRLEISEASMTPALRPGDYVVTDRSPRPLSRGDIVVFEHPGRASFFLVKRVIGIPSEQVTIDSGRVLIDGTPLDEPWTVDQTGPDGSWELSSHEAFVLGDARWMSTGDSREIGPAPVDRLSMTVAFRYWPLERFGPVH